ncbi:MAG: hypothetical protein COB35_12700 [Gammaproteobacteria bacterium]|nr:MAG: hypothetical protein COB35_12700 [Gammaproteobacteria bacterium]
MMNKSQIAFYRKTLIAILIDSGIARVPLLVEATGMGRRTVQEVINNMSDISITCLRTGSTKSGYYYISDWGVLDKNKIKNQLKHINDVLECCLSKQLILDLLEDISMSEQRIMQALFNQQRLQIMGLGVHHNEYDDGYLYAWESGVYPWFSDTDGSVNQMPHECYAEFFKVKKETVQNVLNYLDEKWLAKDIPTFYELEERFGGKWDEENGRIALLVICRYAFLSRRFDKTLWDKLLKPMQHPSEASSICSPLKRDSDIYFMTI